MLYSAHRPPHIWLELVSTLLHETQDVLVVDLWYSKYMIYSLRAFFTVAHFFIGGIVPELYQRPDPGHG